MTKAAVSWTNGEEKKKFWIDAISEEFLELEKMLDLIQPATVYGQHFKKNHVPFLHGEEEKLRGHFEKLQQYENCFGDQIEVVRSFFRQFRNITYSLEKLERKELLNITDFFEFKRFFLQHEEMMQRFFTGGESLELSGFQSLGEALEILDPERKKQIFFSLQSDYLDSLRSRLDEIHVQEQTAFKKLLDTLQKQYELPIKSQKEFVLARSDIRNIGLKKCDFVRIVRENTFSIHYEVVSTGSMAKATHDTMESQPCEEKKFDLRKEKDSVLEEISVEEQRIINELTESLYHHQQVIRRETNLLGIFDFDLAALDFKKCYHCIFPQISSSLAVVLEEGCHIFLRQACQQKELRYDALSIDLEEGVTLIVGANMGGKTTALKTLGLAVCLAQLGIPVPAKYFETPLFRKIFTQYKTREQDGLSGFGTEIIRSKHAFDEFSLNLIDEFASTTNPSEGEALATAFVDFANEKKGHISVFITHFSQPLKIAKYVYLTGLIEETLADTLADTLAVTVAETLADTVADNATGNVAVLSNGLEDLYKMIDHRLHAVTDLLEIPQGAFFIAKTLGFSDRILEKAKTYLRNLSS